MVIDFIRCSSSADIALAVVSVVQRAQPSWRVPCHQIFAGAGPVIHDLDWVGRLKGYDPGVF
jgi:hypothetical protein